MHRINSFGATKEGRFTEGNDAKQEPATVVSADWLNAVQDEIVALIESEQIDLNRLDRSQLLRAAHAMDKQWRQEVRTAVSGGPALLSIEGDRRPRYRQGTRVMVNQNVVMLTGFVNDSTYVSSSDRTLLSVQWDSDSVGLRPGIVRLSAGPSAGQNQSIGSAAVAFRRGQRGAVLRDLQTRSEAVTYFEDFGGGYDKSAAINDAAMAHCVEAIGQAAGVITFEKPAEYVFGRTIDLPSDVSLQGVGYPGTDPTRPPALTRLKRVADAVLINISGKARSRGRTGRNCFRNIGFGELENVSGEPLIRARWADSVVFEHGVCWLNEGATRTGHVIDVEECWDWRFLNWTFKHGGSVKQDRHVLNIVNGNSDNTNDFVFLMTRFQESNGINVNFDSSGGGHNNSRFWFSAVKFEDARKAARTPVHVQGQATKVFFSQTIFAGCRSRHIDMAPRASDWRFTDCQFANGGPETTDYMRLAGTRYRVSGCVLESPGPVMQQYISTSGRLGEVTGCSRGKTEIPLVAAISDGCSVHHNLDFSTEQQGEITFRKNESTKTIQHGLAAMPSRSRVRAWFSSQPGRSANVWISDITSREFTIHLDQAPGLEVSIAWEAMLSGR
jgi:hypothetical protein